MSDRRTQVAVSQVPSVADDPVAKTPRDHGVQAIDGVSGRWWVLHTLARNEKAVAAALEKQQIDCYLPLVRTRRTYGRRSVTFSVPLFPGYLFMCGGTDECYAARDTHRVANLLGVGDQDQIRAELRQIHRLVESGEPVDLYPSLREGRRCRITAGSLRGLEGVVVRKRSTSRMYIAATVLGQSAVIEMDSGALEPID